MAEPVRGSAKGILCPICRLVIESMDSPALPCSFCGKTEASDHSCPHGHYTCEDCRTDSLEDFITRVVATSRLADPWELLNLVLAHRHFQHCGPQFHLVIAPVVLRVLANRGVIPWSEEMGKNAMTATENIPAFSCARRGDCGVAAGAGTVVGILLNADPMKGRERSLALQATGETLLEISRIGSPRCCRQSAIVTISLLGQFLPEKLGIQGWEATGCPPHQRLAECSGAECPFYD